LKFEDVVVREIFSRPSPSPATIVMASRGWRLSENEIFEIQIHFEMETFKITGTREKSDT
jgi:hypothetical protein